MAVRKPPGVSWESWVERQIREGIEAGEFDDLPGAGKPLPDIDKPHDELWWVRDKLRREQVEGVLPPALAVRKQLDDTLDRIAATDDEAEVRQLVATINERIFYVNSHAVSGPPSTLVLLDLERVLERWRAARAEGPTP